MPRWEMGEGMTMALRQFREPRRLANPWLLTLPFIGSTGNYPSGGRGQGEVKKGINVLL
jgi:hypothetical protein